MYRGIGPIWRSLQLCVMDKNPFLDCTESLSLAGFASGNIQFAVSVKLFTNGTDSQCSGIQNQGSNEWAATNVSTWMALKQVTTAVITVHSIPCSTISHQYLGCMHIPCLRQSMCESGFGMCKSLMVACWWSRIAKCTKPLKQLEVVGCCLCAFVQA